MIRAALLSVAVATLTTAAAAQIYERPTASSNDGVIISGHDDESLARGPVRQRARRASRPIPHIAVLPPARRDEVQPDATAAADDAAAGVSAAITANQVGPSSPPVVSVLPPLRPGLPDDPSAETAVADVVPDGTIVRSAGVLPPERPGFASDGAASEIAAASEDATRPPPGAFSVVRVLPPARPGFPWDDEPVQTASVPDGTTVANGTAAADGSALSNVAAPAVPANPLSSLFGSMFRPSASSMPAVAARSGLNSLIAEHARLNGVPEDLVHRIVVRESKYNPGAVGRGGALGLMQIKHATARALGYDGPARGLLDANTNLTYAVKYLAGAYRVAGGDYDQAVRNYARGYYYAAKRKAVVRIASRARRHARDEQAVASDDALPAPSVLANAPVDRAVDIR